jgi:hypothetical protein
MRIPTSPRLTAAAAEELLDGRGAPTPLRGLLAAAAAPGRAEFATARTAELSPAPEWIAPARPLAGKLLAAKVLALVVVAAGATGGVALAANSSLARPLGTAPPSAAASRSPTVEHRTPTSTATPTIAATTIAPLTATPTPTPTGTPPTVAVRQDGRAAKATLAGGRRPTSATRAARASTVDATVPPTGPVAPSAEPVAAAPLAAAPTATPTTEALTATESRFAVDRGLPSAPESGGTGHP